MFSVIFFYSSNLVVNFGASNNRWSLFQPYTQWGDSQQGITSQWPTARDDLRVILSKAWLHYGILHSLGKLSMTTQMNTAGGERTTAEMCRSRCFSKTWSTVVWELGFASNELTSETRKEGVGWVDKFWHGYSYLRGVLAVIKLCTKSRGQMMNKKKLKT